MCLVEDAKFWSECSTELSCLKGQRMCYREVWDYVVPVWS